MRYSIATMMRWLESSLSTMENACGCVVIYHKICIESLFVSPTLSERGIYYSYLWQEKYALFLRYYAFGGVVERNSSPNLSPNEEIFSLRCLDDGHTYQPCADRFVVYGCRTLSTRTTEINWLVIDWILTYQADLKAPARPRGHKEGKRKPHPEKTR